MAVLLTGSFMTPSARVPAAGAPISVQASLTSPGGHPQSPGCPQPHRKQKAGSLFHWHWCHLFFGFPKPNIWNFKVMEGALKSTSYYYLYFYFIFFWWLLEAYLSQWFSLCSCAGWPLQPWSPTFVDWIGQHVRSLLNVYQGGSLHRQT